ncbi:uncharacterized protein LOC116185251 [Apis dorsata]|uniref:uncharacterized protein LOC116185251 n=1 Tax=Apis dorsata TaxID=7462 RepID=UPI001293FA16|nr:uncharacterized protein LOC116185251 [Apis dorsata]
MVKLLRTSFQSIIVVTFRVISLRSCSQNVLLLNFFSLSLETKRKSSKIKDSSVYTPVTLMQFYRCRGGETEYGAGGRGKEGVAGGRSGGDEKNIAKLRVRTLIPTWRYTHTDSSA